MSNSGWIIKTIRELGNGSDCTVQTGPFGSQLHAEDYVDDGVPFILIRNIVDSGLNLKDVPRISLSDAKRLAKYALRPGDIVFSRVGRTGSCLLATDAETGWIISGQTLRLRLNNPELDSRFLLYALRSHAVQNFVSKSSVGTTRESLNTKILESIPISHPGYPVQRRIAEILSTLDETIEQTEALIAKYQQIKAGLMHDLFTRGVTTDSKLRPTRAEEPQLYKESPLGWIPKEWEVQRLDAVADVSRGKFGFRPRNEPRFYGGQYPFIQTGDVALSEGRELSTYSQTLNDLGLSVSRLFPAGTIMVTIAANIADTCIIGIPMCAPDSLVGVQPKTRENARFIELGIRRRKIWLSARAPQTAQRNINLEDLRPLLIPWPEEPERLKISEVYESQESAIEACQAQLQKLHQKKHGLMHDLLTGRVRVKVAD
jgi:type I restriction enzyme, S subunit